MSLFKIPSVLKPESFLTQKMIGSAARHIVTFVAGLMFTYGWISGQDEEIITTISVALASVVWALSQKQSQEKRIDKALDMPAGTSRGLLEAVVKAEKSTPVDPQRF